MWYIEVHSQTVKNLPSQKLRGEKGVKGSRQGALSRLITRRSGRIAKACCKKWFCNSESSLSKKPEGTFSTSCCAGRDASLPAQTVVIMAAAPRFVIARPRRGRGNLAHQTPNSPRPACCPTGFCEIATSASGLLAMTNLFVLRRRITTAIPATAHGGHSP